MAKPKKTTSTEGTAKATLATAKLAADAMVTLTSQRSEVMKQAPGWASHPTVQAAVASWGTASSTVGAGAQSITAAQLTLNALEATQVKNVAAWRRATLSVVAAVNDASGGSAEVIKQWGLDVVQHAPIVDTPDPPIGLRAVYSRQLVLALVWKGAANQRGYLVQIGDGTPTGWGPSIPSTRARYVPAGLTPGQKISVRVAVIRKSGTSAWSDPLSLVVR
jgi:hypothetical protein